MLMVFHSALTISDGRCAMRQRAFRVFARKGDGLPAAVGRVKEGAISGRVCGFRIMFALCARICFYMCVPKPSFHRYLRGAGIFRLRP
jgi:hypothetical protein